MPLLSQIVAISKGVNSTVGRDLLASQKTLQTDPLFSGVIRTYDPKDDDGDRLPSESTEVRTNAETVLTEVADSLTRLIDVNFTKDVANTHAKANVVVNGKTLVAAAPVPFLLFLEKQLSDLHGIVSKVPTLDPAERWTLADGGYFASAVAETTKSKKVPKAFVKAPATDKHPAQVDTYNEDVLVGYWSTTKLSGAVPQDRKAAILAKIDQVRDAVKFAREEANSTEVNDQKTAKSVFDYILG